MITVMGATGHTGGAIARRLLARGERVRVLSRSADRLAALTAAGAEPVVGDPADPELLTESFAGAAAVYTLLPVDPTWSDYHAWQDRLGEAIVRAVRAARVPRVVALSSVGADQPAGTGFLTSLHRQEARLRTLTDTDLLILRPGLFFESFYPALGVIREQGVNVDSVAPDLPIPMVATADVAVVAADALVDRGWTGVVVRELLGPRDLTYAEATRIIGDRIGRPDLAYLQVPYPRMARALVDAGFSDDVARQHVEFTRGLNEGRIVARQSRAVNPVTPSRFEEFADELAAAYRAADEVRIEGAA